MWGVSYCFLIMFQTLVAQTNEHYKAAVTRLSHCKAMSHTVGLTHIHPAKWTA
jgi:hypothetical protein